MSNFDSFLCLQIEFCVSYYFHFLTKNWIFISDWSISVKKNYAFLNKTDKK